MGSKTNRTLFPPLEFVNDFKFLNCRGGGFDFPFFYPQADQPKSWDPFLGCRTFCSDPSVLYNYHVNTVNIMFSVKISAL